VSPLEWIRIAADAAKVQARGGGLVAGVAARLRGRVHSRERDRQAIAHHYDVSNDFYALFLDARMVYSCGYFPNGDETLDRAQEAKLDLICRKLRLQPGERFLDIGCGWGALAIHAAERFGVTSTGVTLSQKQLDLARQRARDAGLEERVRFELRDYRDVAGQFDKIASIGMAEHVGRETLPTYFRTAYEHLAPGGLMLNHAIHRGPIRSEVDGRVVSGEFMRRYVFPDGEILPLWQSLEAAESAGFEVRDVEDLREHYAQTLRAWVRNLEARWDDAVRVAGPERARLWRVYMAGSAHRFAAGHLAIHQALHAKPDVRGRAHVPRTRADLYA
jgi:cyclopropane-fatty-acyl-phospholipid synthase